MMEDDFFPGLSIKVNFLMDTDVFEKMVDERIRQMNTTFTKTEFLYLARDLCLVYNPNKDGQQFKKLIDQKVIKTKIGGMFPDWLELAFVITGIISDIGGAAALIKAIMVWLKKYKEGKEERERKKQIQKVIDETWNYFS